MARPEINYEKLPKHLRGGMRRWIERAITPGHFLQAVINNDFIEVVGGADHINIHRLRDIAEFMYNEAPLGCWRTEERIDAWIEKGGLYG